MNCHGIKSILRPSRTVLLLLLAVFTAAAGGATVLPFLSASCPGLAGALTAGLVTTALSAPLLWYVVGRPRLVARLRERLRAEQIVCHAADGILTTDKQGNLQSLNPSAEQLFGYRSAEVVGKPISSLLVDSPTRKLPRLGSGVPIGSTVGLAAGARELLGRRKDGTTFPLELTLSEAPFGNGQLRVVFTRDVGKRKLAQKHLAAHYAATRALAESGTLGEALPRVLQAVCDNLGWEVGEFWRVDRRAGQVRCAGVHAAGGEGVLEFTAVRQRSSAQPDAGLAGRVWSARETIWIADLASIGDASSLNLAAKAGLSWGAGVPIFGPDGEVEGVLIFFGRQLQKADDQLLRVLADLTGQLGQFVRRKEALAEVQQAREALDAVSACLWSARVDEAGQWEYRYWSPGVRRFTGLGPEAFLSGPEGWERLVSPADQPTWRAALSRAAAGEPVQQEYRLCRPDGAVLWVRESITATPRDGDHDFRLDAVITDITERKHLEEQLHQSQKMEAIGQLAGGIAHDFNNLLTVIQGYSDLLLVRGCSGEESRPVIKEINTAAQRAADLTGQLLAFGRKAIIAPRVLDLKAQLRNTQGMLRRLIGEDIDLQVALDDNLGAIKIDPGQLHQVILNLAVNARDAMPGGGSLTLAARNVERDGPDLRDVLDLTPGSYVLLSVSDTGTGIDEVTRARIFEPFFTTKGDKGTGLGLATSYGIIKQAGGHIEVETAPGRGTTFNIFLPRVAEVVSSRKPSHQGLTHAPAGQETILVVEDEDGVRSLTRHVLAECGYKVLEAADGEEALRIAEEQGPVDLLLTDVIMPRMGGREVVERLASLRPRMKVLYLSGYTDDAVIRSGIKEQDVPFLQKPFTPRALAQKVREIFDTVDAAC